MKYIDFKIVQLDFDNLITATKNKLEREWTPKYPNEIVNGGKFTILSLYRISIVNYGAVIELTNLSEKQNLNLYLGTPSLNRGILENLFSLIYLLVDFPENNKLFIKNSLREKKELLNFYQEHYSGIPKWDDYLLKEFPALKKYETTVDKIVGLTQDEKTNMENMKRFPRVSNIVKYLENRNHPNMNFYKYLEKFHYIQLSHLSHSQPSGLIATGNLLEKPNKKKAEIFITEQRWIAITLIMCLMSEIETHYTAPH